MTATLERYMTRHPHSIRIDEKLTTAAQLMTKLGVRHLPVLDGPDPQPVAERRPANCREREGTLGADSRKAAAIRRHHETVTGWDPLSASASLPRGTTLSTTRRSGFSHVAAACRSCPTVAER